MNDAHKIVKKIQKELNINFFNQDLLICALTHKSYAIEQNIKNFNERLEFLGDSILSSVVADYLYNRYPLHDEGKLSRMKSYIVSRASLVHWSLSIGLDKFMLLSQGEEASGGRKRESLLANVFEALLGALYLDQGYDATHRFIIQYLSKMRRIADIDYKSKLQEMIQQKLKSTPEYRIVRETGPDHNKRFAIEVKIKKEVLGAGDGRSKKEAEQAAARAALKAINHNGLPK